MRPCPIFVAGLLLAAPARDAAAQLVSYRVEGDGIAASLTGRAGDPVRGRGVVASRQAGLCLLCHAVPIPEERFQGSIGPDLRGVGARLSPAQLRLRVVDASQVNPDTVMPSYYMVAGRTRVGAAWRDRPVLDAGQVEDVVAYLATLDDRP